MFTCPTTKVCYHLFKYLYKIIIIRFKLILLQNGSFRKLFWIIRVLCLKVKWNKASPTFLYYFNFHTKNVWAFIKKKVSLMDYLIYWLYCLSYFDSFLIIFQRKIVFFVLNFYLFLRRKLLGPLELFTWLRRYMECIYSTFGLSEQWFKRKTKVMFLLFPGIEVLSNGSNFWLSLNVFENFP